MIISLLRPAWASLAWRHPTAFGPRSYQTLERRKLFVVLNIGVPLKNQIILTHAERRKHEVRSKDVEPLPRAPHGTSIEVQNR